MERADARRIVVTGATRGLGRALCERFREAGHRVAGCGRSADAVTELAGRFGPPHDFAVVDVADGRVVRAWQERLATSFGTPDLLVNGAALMNTPAPLWEVSAEEFDRLLAVNVSGTANTVRAFVPAMIRAGRGVIVNVSSGWGRSASPAVGPYCASKWAIEGFTRSLAQELPAQLAAVAVNPGIVDTAMLRKCWEEAAASYPTPDDWSRAAAEFLLELGPRDNGRSVDVMGART